MQIRANGESRPLRTVTKTFEVDSAFWVNLKKLAGHEQDAPAARSLLKLLVWVFKNHYDRGRVILSAKPGADCERFLIERTRKGHGGLGDTVIVRLETGHAFWKRLRAYQRREEQRVTGKLPVKTRAAIRERDIDLFMRGLKTFLWANISRHRQGRTIFSARPDGAAPEAFDIKL